MSFNAEDYINSHEVEGLWAIKAFEHAETYFNLISILDCSELKFTSCDDKIYNKFRTEMKDMKIDVLDADKLKSTVGKELWRQFCESFKGIVEDYNFGTLIRVDASKGPTDENTMLVPRIQFWAIEIARNREGLNKSFLPKTKNANVQVELPENVE